MRDFLLVLILLILIAFLFRLDVAFYFIYVLIGLWALARFGYERGYRRLVVERDFAPQAFHGDKVTIRLRVHNSTRLPIPWLRLVDAAPIQLSGSNVPRLVVSLRGRESRQFSYTLDAARRGYYPIGPLQISGGDVLGLLEMSTTFPDLRYLTIYPRIVPLESLGLDSRQPFGILRSRQPLFEDPSRLAGVRDYRRGDSIRTIHWKLSAHTEGLQVKKLEPAISLESALLLNLNRDEYQKKEWQATSEWGITLAASLAYYLSEQGQAVGLSVHGDDPFHVEHSFQDIPPRGGRAHLMQVLGGLARVEVTQRGAYAEWLPEATLRLNWGATLLAITPSATEAVLMALHQQARRGFHTILLVIEPYGQFAIIRKRCAQMGIEAHNLIGERDLKQWTQRSTLRLHSI